MRRLLPSDGPPVEVDPATAYVADRPAPAGRPWVTLSMVSSVDGAAAVAGLSGGLGGDGDHAAFMALRALADVVLVASGTVKAEDYGRPAAGPATREARRARGQSDAPRLVVVSGRLDLDPTARLFADPPAELDRRPLLVHPPDAPVQARTRLAAVAELTEVAGGADGRGTSPAAVLGELAVRGVRLVLAEGGPHFAGQLIAADLVDEMCLSLDPVVVGGDAPRIVVGGPPHGPRQFRTDQVLEADGVLLLRLVRER